MVSSDTTLHALRIALTTLVAAAFLAGFGVALVVVWWKERK